jgi:hypothetical protein
VVIPSLAASYQSSDWDSLAAGELALLRHDESRSISTYGASLGAATFARDRHVRLSLDLLVGSGLGLGLSAGPTLVLQSLEPARPGARATLWYFAGVAPYLSAGLMTDGEAHLEIGLKIPLPAWRW